MTRLEKIHISHKYGPKIREVLLFLKPGWTTIHNNIFNILFIYSPSYWAIKSKQANIEMGF